MIFNLKRIDENIAKRLRWFLKKYDFGNKIRKQQSVENHVSGGQGGILIRIKLLRRKVKQANVQLTDFSRSEK